MFKTLVVILSGALIALSSAQLLDNRAIYKIINKADSGVLSLKGSDSSRVYLRTDADSAIQKWRAKKPKSVIEVMSSGYEFKVSSDESSELSVDKISSSVRALPTTGAEKYWTVRDAGSGQFEVKNYDTKTCLTSSGLNQPVTMSPCTNSPQQQWKFKEL